MYMRRLTCVCVFFLALAYGMNAYHVFAQKKPLLSMHKDLIDGVARLSPFARDPFWERNINRILYSKGYVESVKETTRYKRKYRIEVIDKNSSDAFSIRYYVYTDNDEYVELLRKNVLFEFKGQFTVYTPLNSRRNAYILDVILEDGALLVE
jgi:hypothetical protein